MSGPKKDKVILSEQGVVTEEALTAYLQNKLSPDEKQQLEKLLLEDPFARDALEGLQSSLNQSAVQISISSLNKKVRERSGLKERKGLKIHWVSYAWAAVVFGLIIGIGFIMVNFLNKKDDGLAVSGKKETVETPLMQDTTSVSAKPQSVITDSSVSIRRVTDSIAVSAPTGGVAQNKPLPNAANGSTGSTAINKPVQPALPQTAAAANPKTVQNSALSKGRVDTIVTASKNMPPVSTETKDAGALQDDAMKSFNSGDYNTAADDFDKILKRDPDNVDALYFGGISDYINGKTTKSENNFDKLLKKGSKYMEGSKWYKANILIKKGHSEAAKPLLQDLSNSNGSYKERAIKKLAEMGF